ESASPWTYAPQMDLNTGRFFALEYAQRDGRIVTAGGSGSESHGDNDFFDLYTTEIFDPVRMSWSYGAELPSVHPYWADEAGLPADFKVCAFGTFGSVGQAGLRHGLGFFGPVGGSNASPTPLKNAYVYVPAK